MTTTKTMLITGGARGQGRALALRAADAGYNIALVDRCEDIPPLDYPLSTKADLDETVEMVATRGAEVIAHVGDVRDQDAMDAIAAAAIDRFGSIDMVAANAGVHSFKPFWEMGDNEWSAVVDTNLTGVWRIAKSVAPHMISRGSGSIVITSSVMGVESSPEIAHYAAAKHGVLGLMKSIAVELGPHGIRCNAVLPSVVHSAMGENDMTRRWIFKNDHATTQDYVEATKQWHILPGQPGLPPDAIAQAVMWLCSDAARYVTGVELPIDAGHLVLAGFNTQVQPTPENAEVGPWY